MARSTAPIRGRLESLSLSEIVQFVTLGCKTGRLTLRQRRRKGRIWFEEGKVRHAETGKMSGEQAFITMIGWSAGDFVLTDRKHTEKKTLDQDAMLLVMEGLRQLDEASLTAPAATASPTRGRSVRLAIEIGILVVALACLLVVEVGLPRQILAGLGFGSQPTRSSAEAETVTGVIGDSGVDSSFGVAFGAPTWDAQLWTAADVASGEAVFVFDALDPELYGNEMQANGHEADVDPVRQAAAEPEVAEGVEELLSLGLESGAEEPFWMASLPADEEGFLAIMGESRIRSGHLTILVNDQVVYDQELVSNHKKAKRFFRKLAGKVEQTFEATIPMVGGTHEVVARLHVDGKPDRYENRLTVEVEPGATRNLSLFAGRSSGRLLSLTLD